MLKVEEELSTYYNNHYKNVGYHKIANGFILHSKPYITVKSENVAIHELSCRAINKIKECCSQLNIDLECGVIYKNIIAFPNGDFISLKHFKILSQKSSDGDYLWVTTGDGNTEMSHRVIAKCFIPNPDNLPCVNHKDGDKQNNTVDNLEWCTHSYNTCHAYKTGLEKTVVGEAHHNHKLSNDIIRYIRNICIPNDKHFGYQALALKFNVDRATIKSVYKRETWKEVQ